MRFIETPVFTRIATRIWSDDELFALQFVLMRQPNAGPVIPRSGGLRKIRWSLAGKGKRGGARVIYFWDQPSETFYLLYAYRKNEQEDLTVDQIRTLSRLVREEFP